MPNCKYQSYCLCDSLKEIVMNLNSLGFYSYNWVFCFLIFLTVSLAQASAVCTSWYEIATEPSLWKRFCGQPKWRLSRAGESKQLLQHMKSDGTIQVCVNFPYHM